MPLNAAVTMRRRHQISQILPTIAEALRDTNEMQPGDGGGSGAGTLAADTFDTAAGDKDEDRARIIRQEVRNYLASGKGDLYGDSNARGGGGGGIASPAKRASCLWRCFCCWQNLLPVISCVACGKLAMLMLTWALFSSHAQNHGDIVPLVYNIQNTVCRPIVDFHNLHEHVYFGRRLPVYIDSLEQHIRNHAMVGLTAYHVGLPLCLMVIASSDGQTLSRQNYTIIANPTIVAWSESHPVDLLETDISCSHTPASTVTRYRSVQVQYTPVRPDRGPSREITQTFEGSVAFIVQHLQDTLIGRNMCNADD